MSEIKTLFMIGFMGAGKSSISAELAKRLGRSVVEMDAAIVEQEGMPITEIFAQKGEPYFRNLETEFLKAFANKEPAVVSCGGGVPLREVNVEVMREVGTIILLTARPEVILERVKDDHSRPLLEGHKDTEYIGNLMAQRKPKYDAAADITIDTSDLTIEEIGDKILEQLGA